MADALKITIADNIDEVIKFYDRDIRKALIMATRRALNRGTKTEFVMLRKAVQKHRKIKTKAFKKLAKVSKARGNSINGLQATLNVFGAPVPLIAFLKGAASPTSKKRTNAKNRKLVKVTVRPGKTLTLKNSFIAKAKRGAFRYQIFSRRTSKKGPIVMHSVPSLPILLRKRKGLISDLVTKTKRNISRILVQQFNFLLDKNKTKGKTKVRKR